MLQILLLGPILIRLGLICDLLWILGAGAARGWLRKSVGFVKAQRYVTGSVFIAAL